MHQQHKPKAKTNQVHWPKTSNVCGPKCSTSMGKCSTSMGKSRNVFNKSRKVKDQKVKEHHHGKAKMHNLYRLKSSTT